MGELNKGCVLKLAEGPVTHSWLNQMAETWKIMTTMCESSSMTIN